MYVVGTCLLELLGMLEWGVFMYTIYFYIFLEYVDHRK